MQCDRLRETIVSLEEVLLLKNKSVSSLSVKNRGSAQLLRNSSEKVFYLF